MRSRVSVNALHGEKGQSTQKHQVPALIASEDKGFIKHEEPTYLEPDPDKALLYVLRQRTAGTMGLDLHHGPITVMLGG